MKNLCAALVKAQSQIKPALKDSKNPHYRSNYADLSSVWDACRDALHKNGLCVVQFTDIHEDGTTVLVTKIIHESSEEMFGRYPILCKDANDPQKFLSAITYARRAALAAAVGVVAEDDDGNTAAGITTQQPTPKAFDAPKPVDVKPFVQSPKFVASDPAHKNIMFMHMKYFREKNNTWSDEYTKTHGAKAAALFAEQGLCLNDLKDALHKYALENK